jgi:hypothetical protein
MILLLALLFLEFISDELNSIIGHVIEFRQENNSAVFAFETHLKARSTSAKASAFVARHGRSVRTFPVF